MIFIFEFNWKVIENGYQIDLNLEIKFYSKFGSVILELINIYEQFYETVFLTRIWTHVWSN